MRVLAIAIVALAHSGQATAAVCAGGATVQGVDVSSFAGTVDWSSVAGSGVSFAYARVSDGTTFLDPDFDQNYAGIAAAGMVRGAYQFFEPAQDPVAQAKLLLQKIVLPLQPGDLPPALDVEITGGQSASTIAANIASEGETPIDPSTSALRACAQGARARTEAPRLVAINEAFVVRTIVPRV